ncbi:MAG: hypothetical protein ABFD52_04885 [Acidobacteriota bacterium]
MASKKGFYFETSDFDKKFREFCEQAGTKLAAQGLFTAAQAVLKASDDEIPQTPYLHGDLRASRLVKEPEISGDKISVSFGYNSPYAAVQHEGHREDGSYPIKNYTRTRVPGPGSKFLEKKMAGHSRHFMQIAVDYIREKLGQNFKGSGK